MLLHLDTTAGFDGMALAGALAHLGVDMRPVLEALQRFDQPCRLQGVQRGPAGPGFRLVPAEEALPADGLWPVSGLRAALEALPLPEDKKFFCSIIERVYFYFFIFISFDFVFIRVKKIYHF